ncbi:capsule biosynthesis protein CapA [Campylobacter coli]|nr:capsule biosynthesis protein CapA [Campylobacter coli]EAJ7257632.1 capsule biosynthesis protein CapA [Campylobacter coli]EAK5434701.1 capsule biosynthesis protein CapA [Campylobacter coli]
MIFKDEDCIDLAKNKKAIQSSISKWSQVNDACRACRDDLYIENFSFHTGIEDNPWWMLDLEKEEEIDCIRITNRREEHYKVFNRDNLKVEISLDRQIWIGIDSNMYEWKNNDLLEINLYKSCNARYIKIFLDKKAHLVLRKVEVFVRKCKGYVVGSRVDALGMRIAALINAMFIAKKLDFKFMFTWVKGTDVDFMGANASIKSVATAGEILTAEEVFCENFIKQHCVDDKYYTYSSDVTNLSFEDSESNFYRQKWGIYASPYRLSDDMKDLSKEEYLKGVSLCYQEIMWSKKCKSILKDVQKAHRLISEGRFFCLHIRGGEIVKGNFKIAPEVWMKERHFPYEIAIEIAKGLFNKNHIVIFGQDFIANKQLEIYLNEIKPNRQIKIICIDTLMEECNLIYSNKERAFFELNLMSKADKIYTTGGSMYSNLAEMISGKNIICSFYDMYSPDEIYDVLLKNLYCLELDNLNRAYSYYRIYSLSRVLGKSIELSLEFIYKALECDYENDFFRICILECLFIKKDFDGIEDRLKNYFLKTSFFEAICGVHNRYKHVQNYYEKIRKYYIDFKDKKRYPYISFMAAKIALYKKDYRRAREFIFYSLNNDNNNILFIECAKEIDSKEGYK